MSEEKKPLLVPSLVKMKCPNCRKGRLFVNRTSVSVNKNLAMHTYCEHCGMKLVKEDNNGFGINYVLTMLTFFLNILWYWPIFGFSMKDNSIFYYLGASTLVTILLQPWYLRLSRTLFLYFSVSYGSHHVVKK
ncbi:MAG: hypothetical protein JST82_13360 [Bacteroidetes bacterium]|nr:hypothetical protein [Bacteroidota bacterium]